MILERARQTTRKKKKRLAQQHNTAGIRATRAPIGVGPLRSCGPFCYLRARQSCEAWGVGVPRAWWRCAIRYVCLISVLGEISTSSCQHQPHHHAVLDAGAPIGIGPPRSCGPLCYLRVWQSCEAWGVGVPRAWGRCALRCGCLTSVLGEISTRAKKSPVSSRR